MYASAVVDRRSPHKIYNHPNYCIHVYDCVLGGGAYAISNPIEIRRHTESNINNNFTDSHSAISRKVAIEFSAIEQAH